MEAIRSSETLGATQRTTRRHIPVDDTLQLLLCFVGYEVLTAVVMKSSVFWDITPCNPIEDSSETSVDFQQTTRRYIP
jgi:hypothetical protein